MKKILYITLVLSVLFGIAVTSVYRVYQNEQKAKTGEIAVPETMKKMVERLVAEEIAKQGFTVQTQVVYKFEEINAANIQSDWAIFDRWQAKWSDDGRTYHYEIGFRADGHLMWRKGGLVQ